MIYDYENTPHHLIPGEIKYYEINGYKYKFTNVHPAMGILRGWSVKHKQWAWICEKWLQVDGAGIVFYKDVT